MLDSKTYAAIVGAMRRVWHKSPQRVAFVKLSQIRETFIDKNGKPTESIRVFYRCSSCGVKCKQVATESHPKMEVDHIDPVVPLDGRQLTLDELAARIFVEPSALAIMCQACHRLKSNEENKIRRINKKGRQDAIKADNKGAGRTSDT